VLPLVPHTNAIETVLWQHGHVTCTSRVVARDHIEIRLTVNGIVADRVIFSDPDAAARLAIEMLHDHAPSYL
jgi:hypothetical protein